MPQLKRHQRPQKRLCMLGLEFMCWGRLSGGPQYPMNNNSRWESQKRFCTVFRKKRRAVTH